MAAWRSASFEKNKTRSGSSHLIALSHAFNNVSMAGSLLTNSLRSSELFFGLRLQMRSSIVRNAFSSAFGFSSLTLCAMVKIRIHWFCKNASKNPATSPVSTRIATSFSANSRARRIFSCFSANATGSIMACSAVCSSSFRKASRSATTSEKRSICWSKSCCTFSTMPSII